MAFSWAASTAVTAAIANKTSLENISAFGDGSPSDEVEWDGQVVKMCFGLLIYPQGVVKWHGLAADG
jgi:hypothetical protein